MPVSIMGAGSWPGFSAPNAAPCEWAGEQRRITEIPKSLPTPMEDPGEILIWPAPMLAVVALWGVNQQMEVLPVSHHPSL